MAEIKTVSIDDLAQELSEATEVYYLYVRKSILEYIRHIEEIDGKTVNPERMEPGDANFIKQAFLRNYEEWSDDAIEVLKDELAYPTDPYDLDDGDEYTRLAAICKARDNGATLDALVSATGIPRKDVLRILGESYYFPA